MKMSGEKNNLLKTQSSPFTSIPIEIVVSVGKIRSILHEIIELEENDILILDKCVEDSVDLIVGDRLIARGQLEELDGDQLGQLSVRLIEILPSQTALK